MIDEAMGLASMNPMVGTTPNNSVMLLHNIDDKDLSDGWDSYGLATTLDRDDAHITKDKDGKLIARPNKDLDGKLVEVYICKYEKVQENFVHLAEEKYFEENPAIKNSDLFRTMKITSYRVYLRTIYQKLLDILKIELPELIEVGE